MRGFTLIELVVVVTIVVIISIGVSVNYFSFDSRQKLRSESKELLSFIDKTRTRALVLEYPNGCESLLLYTLRSSSTVGRFEAVAVCKTGSFIVEFLDVLKSTVIQSAISISFIPQSGEIEGGSDKVFKIFDKNSSSQSTTLIIDAHVISKSRTVE